MLRLKKRHLSSQAATRDPGGSRLLAPSLGSSGDSALAIVGMFEWRRHKYTAALIADRERDRDRHGMHETRSDAESKPRLQVKGILDARTELQPQSRREGGERDGDGNRNKATDRPLGFIIGPHHLAQRH
jgi:hypothetical protein